MSLQFSLDLSWSQVSLFDASLTDPYNDWTEQHLEQGFSWRPGSVSFRLPSRSGALDISVELVDTLRVDTDARWAIVVPFNTWAGTIEISTMAQSEAIEIPSGRFALVYQTGIRDGRTWAHFALMESRLHVEPRILKGDEVVHAGAELLMQAEPAA